MYELSWPHLCGLGVVLIPCMITDIRYRIIPPIFMSVCLIAACLVNCFVLKTSLLTVAAGGIFGLAFIGISMMSHGAIGLGDGILIMVLGVWCGFGTAVFMTLTALIIATIFGLTVLWAKHDGGHLELPLAPFFSVPWILLVVLRIAAEAG